jgi:DHA2 family lincomycin resistance protein-like MFS transporter
MQAGASHSMSARDRQVIAILLVAAFVVILNETIMSVALPRLMVDLGISARTVQWLTTAFMLTMAVVIPTTGFLLQRVSTRTVFMLAMGLFSAGTFAAALSPSSGCCDCPRRAGPGHSSDDPAADDDRTDMVPAEAPRCGDGKYHHCDLGRAGHWSDAVGLVLQFCLWRFMFVLVLPIALASLIYGSRAAGEHRSRGSSGNSICDRCCFRSRPSAAWSMGLASWVGAPQDLRLPSASSHSAWSAC